MLDRLLTEPFNGRDGIRGQLANATVRSIDSDGSLEFRVSGGDQVPVDRRIPVEAETLDADGVVVHVLLHVVDGYARELEIYREDSRPLKTQIDPSKMRILLF